MSKTPQRPVSGDPVPSGWFGELFDWIEAGTTEITLLRRIVGQLQARRPTVRTAAGAAAEYDGPFSVTQDPDAVNKVIVGVNRETTWPATEYRGDKILVHPDVLTLSTPQHVTVTATGFIYIAITREGTVAAAAPAFAATLPADTSSVINVPLARVLWDAGTSAVSAIWQMQYGNIIIDKTSPSYCAT